MTEGMELAPICPGSQRRLRRAHQSRHISWHTSLLSPFSSSFLRLVADFAAKVSVHLLTKTYLGSANGSYADVVVAGLTKALIKKGAKVEGENFVRWYNTAGHVLGYEPVAVESEKKENKAERKAEEVRCPKLCLLIAQSASEGPSKVSEHQQPP